MGLCISNIFKYFCISDIFMDRRMNLRECWRVRMPGMGRVGGVDCGAGEYDTCTITHCAE